MKLIKTRTPRLKTEAAVRLKEFAGSDEDDDYMILRLVESRGQFILKVNSEDYNLAIRQINRLKGLTSDVSRQAFVTVTESHFRRPGLEVLQSRSDSGTQSRPDA